MESFITLFLGYGVIGLSVGLLSGMLGIGGGVIMVPALSLFLDVQGMSGTQIMPMIAATSLAVIACTSSFSLRHHMRHGQAVGDVYMRLVVGLIIGVLMGVILGVSLHPSLLKVLLGVFLIGVAAMMFLGIEAKPHRELPGALGVSSVFFLVGLKSGLFGLGGGFMTTPFLLYCNVPARKAIAVASAASATIAITGVACFMTMYAVHHVSLPYYTVGYVYLPAFLGIVLFSTWSVRFGVDWSQHMPILWLRRFLAGFIFVAGLDMLIS